MDGRSTAGDETTSRAAAGQDGRVSRPERAELERRLGTGDAVAVGLGAMVGAGVFAVLAPAAPAAGRALLAGLAGAGGVAPGHGQ